MVQDIDMYQSSYPRQEAINFVKKSQLTDVDQVSRSPKFVPTNSTSTYPLIEMTNLLQFDPRLISAKWGWACRALDADEVYTLDKFGENPKPGDVVVVEVEAIGNHTKIMTSENRRLRLYPGDLIVGVMGNRYATDAYEAEVVGTNDLHLLTNAGMIGTVLTKNQKIKRPSKVTFRGFLTAENGHRVNLKERLFQPMSPGIKVNRPILFVVGSGMNSGKTTAAVKLVKALVDRNVQVAACKLTGSVSCNDYGEYAATAAVHVSDFSDYGFPSTYMACHTELIKLFTTMIADAAKAQPHITIVEIADGILQSETKMMLENNYIRESIDGVVLAANCSTSALFGQELLGSLGHHALCVSGLITSSPLFMEEYVSNGKLPIASSADNGDELADHILNSVELSAIR